MVVMDACQILLGRSWQYDVNATHKGRFNVFVFEWKGKKITLHPTNDKLVLQILMVGEQIVLLSANFETV